MKHYLQTIVAFLLILGITTLSQAAGICKAALNQSYLTLASQYLQVSIECIGDASNGTVPAITIPFKKATDTATVFGFSEVQYSLDGFSIYSVETIPVSAPVTAYTITFTNIYGTTIWPVTVRSTTLKEVAFVTSFLDGFPAVMSPVTVQLSAIGNSKRVDLHIIFRTTKAR